MHQEFYRHRFNQFVAFAMIALCAVSTHESNAAEDQTEAQPYMRVVEQRGKAVSLEIATTTFVHEDKAKPKIALVGVAHIGDQSFYDAVTELLKTYDVVLYESVKPAGTGGAGGETDEQRIESTKAAMQFVASVIETHLKKKESYPTDVAAIEAFAAESDPRMLEFIRTAMIDAWGNPLNYQLHPKSDAAPATYALTSFGADAKAGGEGAAVDISLRDLPTPQSIDAESEDGLQSQLAEALNLAFQLDALPYDTANWRCSDMAMDELNRRFAAKGLDFSVLGDSLGGTSLPATLIKMLLGLMKMADAFAEGAITDTFKIVMIELLGDPAIVEVGLGQLGKGFGEIIVDDRNQVVIDDVNHIIEHEPAVKSIALLYGAAHMPDFAERLGDQMGYTQDTAETQWLPAISVDLTKSKVPAAQVESMRRMVKQMLRQQMRLR